MSTVVFAPDSFKGTVSAAVAASAIARGWASVSPGDELVCRPMADGGEGTIDAFETATPGARRVSAVVTGPDDREVEAEWLLLPDGTGVIELAAASGLHLLDPLRPLDAHSLGFGQLIVAALDGGADKLVLAIGGSASTDGGVGMLTALGARFLDANGEPIPLGNRGLSGLASVDLADLRTPPAGSIGLSDVTNDLLGTKGAARVFGWQKGANEAQIDTMDDNLDHLAKVLELESLAAASSAGAAGGVGFGLLVWGVELDPGARTVGELIGLPDALASADLAITGEGMFDEQTAAGKVAHYVGSTATAAGVPMALIAGVIDARTDMFVDLVSLSSLAGSAAAARADAEHWLAEAGAALARRFVERHAS